MNTEERDFVSMHYSRHISDQHQITIKFRLSLRHVQIEVEERGQQHHHRDKESFLFRLGLFLSDSDFYLGYTRDKRRKNTLDKLRVERLYNHKKKRRKSSVLSPSNCRTESERVAFFLRSVSNRELLFINSTSSDHERRC